MKGPLVVLAVGAGLCGKVLVNVVKVAAVLTARTFFPRTWPALQVACCLQIQPLRTQLPTPVQIVTAPLRPFSAPLLALNIFAPVIRILFPDYWRTLRYWRRLLPIYAGYMKTKFAAKGKSKEERDRLWAVRHNWGGEKVYRLTLEMSGFYTKSAQVLASNSGFMPEPWIRRLSALFDSAPPRPFSEVFRSISEQLPETPYGKACGRRGNGLPPMSSPFLEIDPIALAAASIAQVHSARLLDGTSVVVKVQHLGMKKLMDSDLRNIGRVARFLKSQLPFDLTSIIQEIQTTIPLEFDFRREVAFMRHIKGSLTDNGFERVVCPKPFTEFSAKRMIVMEKLEGIPFSKIVNSSPGSAIKVKAREALEALVHAYGQMLLVDGIFHADPHPGNLLLMPGGRLGLLDYGQSKVLLEDTRLKLARLFLALAAGDENEIKETLTAAGMEFGGPGYDVVSNSVLAKCAYMMFDTRQVPEALVSPLSADCLLQNAPLTTFNRDIWLVVRAVLLLRGLCTSLDLDISAAIIWQPYAAKILQESSDADRIARVFLAQLEGMSETVQL